MSAYVKKRRIVADGICVETAIVKLICYAPVTKRTRCALQHKVANFMAECGAVAPHYVMLPNDKVLPKPVDENCQIHLERRAANGFAHTESIVCDAYELHVPMSMGEWFNGNATTLFVDVHFADSKVNVPYAFKKDVFGTKPKMTSRASAPKRNELEITYRTIDGDKMPVRTEHK